MQNHDRVVGSVTLTQVPNTVTEGRDATVAANMTGDWQISSGYGIDRDHAIALDGAVGRELKNVITTTNGNYQGSISASGASPPVVNGTQATLSLTGTIRFGDDHVGMIQIDLVYQR